MKRNDAVGDRLNSPDTVVHLHSVQKNRRLYGRHGPPKVLWRCKGFGYAAKARQYGFATFGADHDRLSTWAVARRKNGLDSFEQTAITFHRPKANLIGQFLGQFVATGK